ncbi:MFS transporter [Streptomyces sp. NPDC058280]|uniref:MFS transporter n=1 Tax=Streptomyces sp. NPDC058280 TaxID=3346419 RepID=UPI0036DFD285
MTSILGDTDVRRFVVARALSRLGDAVYPIGLTAAMLSAGYGISEVGFVLGAAMGPVVLLMLVGGVVLDHFHPRIPMIVADLARCLLQGCVALLFLTGRPAMWQIIALSASIGVAQAFFQPGVAGLLRQLAPTRLQEANATVRTTESIVALAGPALAGLLIAVTDASMVIAMDALSYAASGWLLWRIRKAPATRPTGPPRVWLDLATGWQEFSSRPWLWSVVSMFTLFGLVVFGPFDVLKAVLLIDRFGASTYGLLISAFPLGAIAGGLLGLWIKPGRPLRTGITALAGLAPLPAAIALEAPLAVLALAMVLGGTANAFWAVTWATAVQSQSPPHALSRISAYDVIGSTGLMPVGRALTGPAAAQVGAATVLLSSSAFLVLGCAVLLLVPSVVRMSRIPAVTKKPHPAPSASHVREA